MAQLTEEEKERFNQRHPMTHEEWRASDRVWRARVREQKKHLKSGQTPPPPQPTWFKCRARCPDYEIRERDGFLYAAWTQDGLSRTVLARAEMPVGESEMREYRMDIIGRSFEQMNEIEACAASTVGRAEVP